MTILDNSLIDKAVNAILDHHEKKSENVGKKQLIKSYSKPLLAQVQLAKDLAQPIINPIKIPIPHSLFSADDEDHSICFFCKTEDKPKIDEFLSSNPINGLTTVLSLTQVRKHYNLYKERKELLSTHTHFICDERIFSHLCNLLGKTFGNRNNLPIPIKFKRIEKLPVLIQDVVSSTYMHLHGKSISIRLGHTGLSRSDIIDNVIKGLEYATPLFPQKGTSIINIHIKLSDSPALPIYSKVNDDSFNYLKELMKKQASSEEDIVEEEKEKKKTLNKGDKKKKGKKSIDTVSTPTSTTTAAAAVVMKSKKSSIVSTSVETNTPVSVSKKQATSVKATTTQKKTVSKKK